MANFDAITKFYSDRFASFLKNSGITRSVYRCAFGTKFAARMLFFENVGDEEALMEAALEAGADDIELDEGSAEVLTAPENYAAVYDALVAAGFTPDESEVTMRAQNLSPVSLDDADKVMRLIERLEELDDTQSVYTNADFPAEFAG